MLLDNITLDKSNVLDMPPSCVIYGAPGGGKSTEVARAFQNVLYVQSSPTILHAFADYAAKNPAANLKIPTRVTFDEKFVAQHNNSPTTALLAVISAFVESCDLGKCPYDGIVFDEWNTILERVFAELKSDPWGKFKGKNGGINIFAVFDAFKSLHRSALSIARRTRKSVIFVCHYQGPKYDEDENSSTRGQLKWPGGPKMPMGVADQVVEICAEADVVLQLVVKDSLMSIGDAKAAQRVFLTQLETKWFRKVRGFGVAAEEPLDIETGKGLRELLTKAGYKF